LEANGLNAQQTVPASRKLGKDDALALAREADKLLVSKGKKAAEFDLKGKVPEEAVAAMLGPTGNLRAPTLRSGKTLIVGYNEEQFSKVLLA